MNTLSKLLSTTSIKIATAFENEAGWKMDGDKLALDDSGDPIYIDGEGREMTVGAGKISQLNGEARTHRQQKEAAEAALEKYKVNGKLIDPKKATEAIQKVEALQGNELIEAGKLEEVKNQITQQYEAQIGELKGELDNARGKVDSMVRSNAFASSKFLADKVALPADFFEAKFGNNFKVEDGKLVPYGDDGQPLYSKKNLGGVVADFDEALEMMVSTHPDKDRILRAPDKGGSGGGGGAGNRPGSRAISRSEFDSLDPQKKAETAALAAKGEMTITE